MLDQQDRRAVARGCGPAASASDASRWRSCRPRARRARGAWDRWRARARSRGAAGRRRAGASRGRWRATATPTYSSSSSARFSMRGLLGARAPVAQRSRPTRRPCVRTCRPIITFSSAERLANSRMFWNVRAMPRAATSCGFRPRERPAVERERAAVRVVDAGEHVEQRRLARAVGPDQPVDLAVADRERHVGERLHAAEALADAFGRQQRQRSPGIAAGHARRPPEASSARLPPWGASALGRPCGAHAARPALLLELALAHRRGQDAGGPEQHHQHQREAEQQHADHLGVDDQRPKTARCAGSTV